MAKQFRFDQIPWDCRHVEGDERTVLAFAIIVQGLGHQLLACSGFAHNHHGEIGLRKPGDDPVNVLHCGRATDDGQDLLTGIRGGRRRLPGGQLLQSTAHHIHQLVQVEGFWEIFICTALSCGDGGHDGVLRTHHHYWQFGTELLDAR